MCKESKVAICENCGKMVMACHAKTLNRAIEKQFTELSNEGFTVKTETVEETQARDFASYSECVEKLCTPK